MPVRTWISNLHRSLNLGEPGRIYSELAASWLWVIALGGLLLWIDRLRRKRSTASKPKPARGRARTVRLHGVTGAVLLVAFLFLSATGLTWSANAGANITTLREALDWTTPALKTAITGSETAPAGDHAGHNGAAATTSNAAPAFDVSMFDTATSVARADIITAPLIDIKPATKPGTAWSVTEAGREWPASASAVAVDPATGQITNRLAFEDFNLAAKLTRWGIAAHMGLLFGLPNQLVLLAAALGLAAMVIWGHVMWWQRRPTRGSGWAFGRAPRPGAFLRGHWVGVLAAITVMVTLGMFLPLLGWSLLAFIIVDILVAAIKRCQDTSVVTSNNAASRSA